MSNSSITAVFDGFLAGASSYALYCIPPPDNPYAFTACAFGLCHGLLGIVNAYKEEGSERCAKVQEVSTSIMEIVPLPLVNIELYKASAESSSLALGHGLFIVPLAFDLIAKLFTEEGEETESNTSTLKDLTILGNVISLTFLAVNESNYLYGGMAMVAFLTKYGSMLLESYFEGTGENCVLLGYSVFTCLTSFAITGTQSAAASASG